MRDHRRDTARSSGHDGRTTLFETERGRVARCDCCDQLELRFGNALMIFGADDLAVLLDSLVAADVADADGGATLTLGESGCGWVFDAGEVAELHRLVAGTRLLLDLTGGSRTRDSRTGDSRTGDSRDARDVRARDLPDFPTT